MKKNWLIFFFGSISISVVAQDPFVFKWAKQLAGANGIVSPGEIAVDHAGNTYTACLLAGTVDFDPGAAAYNLTAVNQTLYPGDTTTSVICKLDANGNFVWAKKISPDLNTNVFGHYVSINSICCDPAGNIYAAGEFTGTVDFDPGPGVYNLTTAEQNSFVFKLDACGNFVWAARLARVAEDQDWQSIVSDRFGHIFVAGSFTGVQDFDPGPGIVNLDGTYMDTYISKFDTAGNFIWAIAPRLSANSGWVGICWLAVDNSGDLYSTGEFWGQVDFGGVQLSAPPTFANWDIYICKIDPAGNSIWAKDIGGSSADWGNSIGVDATGNVYTTGLFVGTVDFDPGPGVYNLAPIGSNTYSNYISKLNSNGDFVFAEAVNFGTDWQKIPVDSSGNIYLTGLFSGTTDLDPGPGISNFTAISQWDTYISELNPTGNLVWAKHIGGPGDGTYGSSIAIDSQNIYTTGSFGGIVDFDPSAAVYNLTSLGPNFPNYPINIGDRPSGADVFVHKMSRCTNATYSTLNITDCKPVELNCHRYDSSGVYSQALTNSMGCDSIITLNLVIKKLFSQTTASACESYSWQGKLYNASGDYTDTVMTANGCDSIITLHLTINNGVHQDTTATGCRSFSWHGQNYAVSGNYDYSTNVVDGCADTTTLHLTINDGIRVDTAATACNSFSWHGQNYAVSGNYDYSPNVNGCPDTTTLHLTINNSMHIDTTATACKSFNWHGQNYAVSGNYDYYLTNANGCADTTTLQLTIKTASSSNITQSICPGQSFDGHSSPGTYVDTLTASDGCDSISTLHLVVLSAPLPQLGQDTSICEGGSLDLYPGAFKSYLWQDGSTQSRFVVAQPGLYSVTVSDNCGTATDKILITQKNCDIYFPSAFTPNADGKNDLFRMIGPHNLYDFRLSIYNRWGQLVFSTSDISKGWDGTLNGNLQPPGVYVWFCEFKTPSTIETTRIKGIITLIR